MKMLKNLLMGLMTLITMNSFSVTTYTVTYNSTSNVNCMVGDTLKFYGTTPSGYGVSINTNTVIAIHPCMTSPYYIGYYVIVGGETTFSINTGVIFNGTINVTITTGVNELINSTSIKVFPNPVVDVLKVTTNTKSSVVITTLNGQNVLIDNIQEGTTDIDLTNLSAGIYFVRVGNKTQKIIKQ